MTKLIILTGISGSGKSTYLQNTLLPKTAGRTIVVSTDKIRKELFGTEDCQLDNHAVFETAYHRTRIALREGINVVFDATSMSKKSRRGILAQAKNIKDVSTQCHVILSSPEQALKNQDGRSRKVIDEVLYRQMSAFSVPDEKTEGFTEHTVYVVPFPDSIFRFSVMGRLNGVSQKGKWHTEDAGTHTQLVSEYMVSHSKSTILHVAARYHDIGKVYLHTEDENGHHFHGHANAGAYLFLYLMLSSYLPEKEVKAGVIVTDPLTYIAKLIQYHDAPCHKDFNEEKFRQVHGNPFTDDILMLREADLAGSIPPESI